MGPFLPLLVLLPSLLLGCPKPLIPSGSVSVASSQVLVPGLKPSHYSWKVVRALGLGLEFVFVWKGLSQLTLHTFFGSCSSPEPDRETRAKDPTQFLASGHSIPFWVGQTLLCREQHQEQQRPKAFHLVVPPFPRVWGECPGERKKSAPNTVLSVWESG